MKIGDVYYEKHTVVGISKRTGTVSETAVERVNMLPIDVVLDEIRAEIEKWHKDGTNWSDIRLMKIEDILDNYKAESEEG